MVVLASEDGGGQFKLVFKVFSL